MPDAAAPPSSPDAQLLMAAASGDVDGVSRALAAGAALESRDMRGRSALLLAVADDHLAVAQLLVACGADPNALDAATDAGCKPWRVVAEALLPAGPDMTLRNRYGGISVIPASERGHVEYVRRVVRTGIDVDHVNDLGWTALLEAVILGDGSPPYQEIVGILLAAGADPLLADRQGVTALQHARALGHHSLAALLS